MDAISQWLSKLSSEEQLILMEAARVALADAETFDDVAEQMDIADSELSALRDKLETAMNKTKEGGQ